MASDDAPLLDSDNIRNLLTELGERLAAKGVHAKLFLVGGAAMALAFNTRRTTRDLDAIFEPKTVIYEEAARMAAEKGLPNNWLNDAAKVFMPDRVRPTRGSASFSAPGIEVGVAAPEYLFAMKAQAAR